MLAMRILVTAGPTREYFDSVRFISNPSSGKMGYAIATEAARRGHEVVLLSGPVALPAPRGVKVIHVVTAREMFRAALREFPKCHCAVMIECRYSQYIHGLRIVDAKRGYVNIEVLRSKDSSLGNKAGDHYNRVYPH